MQTLLLLLLEPCLPPLPHPCVWLAGRVAVLPVQGPPVQRGRAEQAGGVPDGDLPPRPGPGDRPGQEAQPHPLKSSGQQ